MPSRRSARRCTCALLPLFMLLHSSSALLAAARSPQQHVARSLTPLLQLGASSGSAPPAGASSAPPTSAAAATRLTMRRGPLLRAVLLGAFSLGSALPALAAEPPCVDVDSASAKDLEALKGGAAWSKCRLPVPQLAAQAAWDARLRVRAATRIPEGRDRMVKVVFCSALARLPRLLRARPSSAPCRSRHPGREAEPLRAQPLP